MFGEWGGLATPPTLSNWNMKQSGVEVASQRYGCSSYPPPWGDKTMVINMYKEIVLIKRIKLYIYYI